MAYNQVVEKRFVKSIKKFDKPLQEIIIHFLKTISLDPYNIAQPLGRSLTGFFSFHFKYAKKDYRIIYTLKENTIYYIHVGTRENLYKEFKRIIN